MLAFLLPFMIHLPAFLLGHFPFSAQRGGSLLAAPFLSPGVLGQIELNDGRQEDIAWIGCPGSLLHFLSDYLYV